MKLSQSEKILKIMIENPNQQWFGASEFQDTNSKWFIGYEATARMSELLKIYPEILMTTKMGRFRLIGLNWNYKEQIDKLYKILGG